MWRDLWRLEQQLGEITLVPAGLEALALDAEFGVVVLQAHEGDAPSQRQILPCLGVAHPRVVLVERDIQTPMQLILHAPVPAHGAREGLQVGADVADIYLL